MRYVAQYIRDGRLEIDNNHTYAARGISSGMPRPRLCRVGESTRPPLKDLGHAALGDAA